MSKVILLTSVITCPNCGSQKNEVMPTNACQYFYECEGCKIRLKPLDGDCCVFCSYGTIKSRLSSGAHPVAHDNLNFMAWFIELNKTGKLVIPIFAV